MASPLESLIGGALGTYGTIQKLQQARQQERQRAKLQDVMLQQQQEKLKEMPQAFKTSQDAAAQNREMLAHNLAVAQLSHDEAKHTYVANRLTDLSSLPKEQRAAHYQTVRNEALKVGVAPAELPEKYGPEAESLINQAAAKSPAAKAKRQFINKVILAKLANQGKLDAATTSKPGAPPGTLVGTSYVSEGSPRELQQAASPQQPSLGAQPATQTQQPPIQGGPAAGAYAQPQNQQRSPVQGGGQRPQSPSITITPSPAAQKAYAQESGKKFADLQEKAAANARTAADASDQIDTFMRAAPNIWTGTGPYMGAIAKWSAAGTQAIKAQNRLALQLLAMQNFGKVTNKEMGIVQNATLNVHMQPEAYAKLAPQLKALAQRNIEYSNFLNAAASVGIRNASQADAIWNKFMRENPAIDTRTGHVNQQNIGNWQRYLSPQMLRGELQTPVYVPKGFVFPGSPTAKKQLTRGQ